MDDRHSLTVNLNRALTRPAIGFARRRQSGIFRKLSTFGD
jgi:hypothetical protein